MFFFKELGEEWRLVSNYTLMCINSGMNLSLFFLSPILIINNNLTSSLTSTIILLNIVVILHIFITTGVLSRNLTYCSEVSHLRMTCWLLITNLRIASSAHGWLIIQFHSWIEALEDNITVSALHETQIDILGNGRRVWINYADIVDSTTADLNDLSVHKRLD